MRAAAMSALFAVLACSSSSSSGTSTGTQADAGPACTRPMDLAAPGTIGAGVCSGGRAVLTCTLSNGVGTICLSDDPTLCEGLSATGPVSATCKDLCTSSEYGVSCGGPGPTQAPKPPTGCRSTPYHDVGGVAFFCCPCL